LRRGLRDCFPEPPEDALDFLPCLRRTDEVRCLKRLGRLFYLLLAERGLVFQVLLLIANATGISPTVRNTDSTHESRSSSVSYRVMSATARMPWAPWKYASRRSSRNPFDPMMSQIVMSICVASPLFGLSAGSVFVPVYPC